MSIVDTLRPSNFDDFIGQEAVKAQIGLSIAASNAAARPLDHVLLTGPAGHGKTSFAAAIAAELYEDFVIIQMPMRDSDYRILRRHQGVVLLDEIHKSPKQQEDLLPLIEFGVLSAVPDGPPIRPTWLTVIAATTEEGDVMETLRTRFTHRLRLRSYESEELALVVAGMAQQLGIFMAPETAAILGRASGFVPRHARSMVLIARDFQEVNHRPATGPEILAFANVEPDGLRSEHVSYLRFLYEQDSAVGLETLVTMLEADKAMVREYERLLVNRHGFVSRSGRGRRLTEAGYTRCESLFNARPTKGTKP